MKKLLNISVIAALAVLPVAANAAEGDREVTALAAASGGSTTALATTSYVQGAYTAVKTQFDKMVTDTAVTTDGNYIDAGKTVSHNLSELDTQAKANADAIAGLQGNGANSVDNKIKTQAAGADYTNASMTGISTISGAIADLDTRTDALETKVGADAMGTTATTVTGAIGEIDGKVDTLTGDANTTGSLANEASIRAAADTAINDKIGSTTMTTTAQTLTGAIEEVKQSVTTLTGNASDTYATKTGTLATINASTVPVVTTWGQDSTVGTVSVAAPNAYQAGTAPAQPTVDCTDPDNASNPACL